MILGIGSDLINIERIWETYDQHGDRFAKRILTPNEFDFAKKRQEKQGLDGYVLYLAKRWAAKEACAKALGTGLVTDGISFQDFETKHTKTGKPYIALSGGAAKRLETLLPEQAKPVIDLSLSDEPPMALAFVVISAWHEKG